MCLLLPADGALLTGDTVLGRGTTVIAQDGNLGDYLASLDRLRALADAEQLRMLLPGHGPLLADPAGVLDFYIAHRQERLAEVRAALAAGDRTPEQIVARVYARCGPVAVAVRAVVGPGPARLSGQPGRAAARRELGSGYWPGRTAGSAGALAPAGRRR